MWRVEKETSDLKDEIAELRREIDRIKRDELSMYVQSKDGDSYCWGGMFPTMHTVPIRTVVDRLAEQAGLVWAEGTKGCLMTKPKKKGSKK